MQNLFASETARVSSAFTESLPVFSTFDLDKDSGAAAQKADVDLALRKVLAVHSELMIDNNLLRSWIRNTANRRRKF